MPRQLWNDKKRLNKLFRGKGEAEAPKTEHLICPTCSKRVCENIDHHSINEPTDEEVLKVSNAMKKYTKFKLARHFYRLGYEKGLKEGLNAPSDRMLMMNTALLKEAEQRGREQGWKDCLTKLESYNPKLTLGVILALNGTALRKEGKEE